MKNNSELFVNNFLKLMEVSENERKKSKGKNVVMMVKIAKLAGLFIVRKHSELFS